MMNLLQEWQPLFETINVVSTAVLSLWVVLLIRTQNRLVSTQAKIEAQERRLALFDAIMVFLVHITMRGTTDSDELQRMLRETRHAQFIFPKTAKIQELVGELYQKGLELEYCEKDIASMGASDLSPPRNACIQKSRELKEWFSGKRAEIERQFQPYLAIQEI
jgi:hypothetical protein